MALEAAVLVSATWQATVDGKAAGAYHAGALVRAERPRLLLAAWMPPRPAEDRAPAPSPAVRDDPELLRLGRLSRKIHFQASTPEACLPRTLMAVLYDVAEAFGEVRIHSTHRDPRRNARVGGVRNSLHLQCRAIDFSVAASPRLVANYLRFHPKVGGFGRYPGSHFHIDDGPRRHW